jgi:hypothetical protein
MDMDAPSICNRWRRRWRRWRRWFGGLRCGSRRLILRTWWWTYDCRHCRWRWRRLSGGWLFKILRIELLKHLVQRVFSVNNCLRVWGWPYRISNIVGLKSTSWVIFRGTYFCGCGCCGATSDGLLAHGSCTCSRQGIIRGNCAGYT